MTKERIIIIDDEINILKMLELSLSSGGYSVEVFQSPMDAIKRAKEVFFDIAFVDLKMEFMNGIEVLEELKSISSETIIILMTAHGTIESAVEAIKKGAYDYITKPFTHKEFTHLVERVVAHNRMNKKIKSLEIQLEDYQNYSGIVGNSTAIKEIVRIADQVAESDIPILIEGESGTGKEVLARYIHDRSPRKESAFIPINCSAIPENLFESELFGHVKGAFTDAIRDRIGRLELANNGTVFLDEVAEIPKSIQIKLLRFLQNMEFERIGQSITRKINVRLISATNKNVRDELEKGNLRDDFYYRIAGVKFKLPPLKERKSDIPILIEHFIKKYSLEKKYFILNDTEKYLLEYNWPGNIRELEAVIKRLLLFAKDGNIKPEYLPEEIMSSKPKSEQVNHIRIEELEKRHIQDVLRTASNTREAAKILGISETTLWRKKKLYNL